MDAVTRGISARHRRVSCPRQEEVVHSSNACHGISQACSHARSKDGRQYRIRIIQDLPFPLDDMDAAGCNLEIHFNAPNTASIAAFIFSIVKGLARTLLAPSCAAFVTSARSPWAVRMMKAAFFVAGLARTA